MYIHSAQISHTKHNVMYTISS